MAELPSRKRFRAAQGALGPREMLERAASTDELPPERLLAVLLRTGAPGCDVLELSRRLIEAHGGDLGALVASDWRTLAATIETHNKDFPDRKITGIGRVKILELAAAFGLARQGMRHADGSLRNLDLKTDTASKAAKVFRRHFFGEEQEVFSVLPVDGGRHPICEPLRIAKGTADRTQVDPGHVFRKAVQWGARAILAAHNHPDGEPAPSEEDLALTRRLAEAGRLIGVSLLDHLVLGAPGSAGGKGYVSVRAEHPDLFAEHRTRNATQEAF